MEELFILPMGLSISGSKCLRKGSTQEWSLLSPVADVEIRQLERAGRNADLNGKTIGLFWNGKPNADLFLDEVAEELRARFEGLKIVRMWEVKPETRTALGNSVENLKFMAQNADLIIGASGD